MGDLIAVRELSTDRSRRLRRSGSGGQALGSAHSSPLGASDAADKLRPPEVTRRFRRDARHSTAPGPSDPAAAGRLSGVRFLAAGSSGAAEALVILDSAARQLCTAFVVSPRRSDYANARLVEASRDQLADVARSRRRTGLISTIGLAEPGRESAAESLSAGHFHLAGLPKPRFQAPVRTPIGTLFPDCFWEAQGLIGECDGAVKYAEGSSAFVAEKEREQVLRDLGYGMVRWLAKEIMARPEQVVARVLSGRYAVS